MIHFHPSDNNLILTHYHYLLHPIQLTKPHKRRPENLVPPQIKLDAFLPKQLSLFLESQ